MAFCIGCGVSLGEGKRFCGECGRDQQGPAVTAPPVPDVEPKKKASGFLIGALIVLGVLVVAGIYGSMNAPESVQRQRAVRNLPPMTVATIEPDDGSFGDGTWKVGDDIKPGTYRSANDSGACYWARLSGLSGGLDDLIANENPGGPTIVTIQETDKGFQSMRCGTWTPD